MVIVVHSPDYFFTPIAQNIGRQARCCLGAVISGRAVVVSREQAIIGVTCVIPFIDHGVVELFSQQICIPQDTEICGIGLA